MNFQFTPSSGYAIVTFGLVLLLVLYLVTRFVCQWVASLVSHAILKYLVYATINLLNYKQPPVQDVVFTIVYISANAVCIGWKIESAQELSSRCASLLVTNLVVLLPGADVAADILQISLKSYLRVHSIIGLVALIEGSIHAALQLTRHKWNNDIVTATGLAAFVCLASMSLASAPSFRNRLYEIFRIIHFGCSTSICILLWLHLLKAERLARIQAGLGLGVWAATYTHRNLLLVYRNFAFSKPRTSIWIENVHNNLVVHIRLARPWSVKPGQYVYLTMARSGFFSIFQRHPFMVASSELEGYDLALRIQPEAGFTRRLLRLCPRNRVKLEASASIEGPYGRGFDLRDYGTVVLLASGMGIVGQLPYIQELVQDYRCSKTKTRDLLLVWLVEDETQRDLVSEILDKTLRGDDLPTIQERHRKSDRPLGEGRTLARPGERPDPHGENIIDMYIYGDYEIFSKDGRRVSQYRKGSRIAEITGKPDIPEIIYDVLNTRKGKIAVCTCAVRHMRYAARETVAQNIVKDIRYFEVDYQPSEPNEMVDKSKSLVFQCRGAGGA